MQPSAAHRVTCLANSRSSLAAQGITGLAALSSLTELPILQTRDLQFVRRTNPASPIGRAFGSGTDLVALAKGSGVRHLRGSFDDSPP